jgi:dihydrodipicolinate synthase/N-acetylneuraminate lyase
MAITSRNLRGIIPPVVTPVHRDETVDHEGLRRVVRRSLDGGVHGIFALGGTGNFCAFTPQERYEVAVTVVKEVDGCVPVLVGCMETSTRLTLQNIERAGEAGADAVVVETPYYYYCTEEDLLSHFKSLALGSPLPVVIYHNPVETKLRIDLALTQELARMPNVIGIKDSSYDFTHFQRLLSTFDRASFAVLQGQESLVAASFLLGAPGAILSIANIVPALCVQLFEAGTAGNVTEVRRLDALLNAAMGMLVEEDEMTTGSFFAGLECAMNALGLCEKVVTSPYSPPSQEHRRKVDEIIAYLRAAQVFS